MSRHEPSPAAQLAVLLARAYPALSAYSAAALADELGRIERAQRMHATRRCNGPAERPGDVPGYFKSRVVPAGQPWEQWEHDPDAEERAGARIGRRVERWVARVVDLTNGNVGEHAPTIELEHDPRGCCLLLRLPGHDDPIRV